MYWYTYAWNWGGDYSGYDIRSINSTFGLGGQAWDLTAFSTNRSGQCSQEFYYNYAWRFAFSTSWRTYGYHRQGLPLGNSRWQGDYDFITDYENYGVNGQNNGGYTYGYTVGGYQGPREILLDGSFYANSWNGTGYLNVYGTESYFWYLQVITIVILTTTSTVLILMAILTSILLF